MIESTISAPDPDFCGYRPELKDTIERLKLFGECSWETRAQWPDYSAFPLDKRRTSELIEILKGEAGSDFNEKSDCWVPVHAWRILAANRVQSAIPALIDLLYELDNDDDWSQNELPEIIAVFGAEAVPAVGQKLLNSPIFAHSVWGCVGLATTLGKIAKEYPDAKSDARDILFSSLAGFEVQSPTFNSFLICELVDLSDSESLPLIQKVFARQFLDETVIDWRHVREKFPGVDSLPEKIKVEKYNVNEFQYNGDELFQKLLKSLGSAYNIDELKCYLLGSLLAIDMVQLSTIADDVLTNILDEEIEFETDGQAMYFYREFFGLWNQLADFQSKLFVLPRFGMGDENGIEEPVKLSIVAMRTQRSIEAFLDGLQRGNTDGDRLKDGDAVEFILGIEEKIDQLESFIDDLSCFDASTANKVINEVHTYWEKGYLKFAATCREVRRRELAGKKFVEEHKWVGRNEPCPCGSGSKFKKCCLAKFH